MTKPTRSHVSRAPMKRGRSAGETTERVDVRRLLETIEAAAGAVGSAAGAVGSAAGRYTVAAKPGEPLIKTGTDLGVQSTTVADPEQGASMKELFGAPPEAVPALEARFPTIGAAPVTGPTEEITRRRPGRSAAGTVGALKKEEE